jgi:hypothetical protein
MRHNLNRCLAATLLFASSASFCVAQVVPYISEKKASYVTIEVPGALGTYPTALNDSMTVTGYDLVSPTVARAFIQDSKGTMTTFSVPNSSWTEPEAINAAGDITGFFEVEAQVPLGFLRYADGRLITFNPSSSVNPSYPGTLPLAINDYDEVAGNQQVNDFTRSRTGAFNNPGFTVDPSFSTTGLNNSGTVVGYDDDDISSSYVVHPDGYFEQFAVYADPFAEDFCTEETVALSVNEGGTIAGWYNQMAWAPVDSPDCAVVAVTGGFVRSPEGLLTLFQTPGPIVTVLNPGRPYYANDVVATLSPPSTLKINAEGIVTGSYTDANMAQHGFVRETDGIITSFDPPRGRNTTATGINASGVITGSYFYDWNAQSSIGFLRIPKN